MRYREIDRCRNSGNAISVIGRAYRTRYLYRPPPPHRRFIDRSALFFRARPFNLTPASNDRSIDRPRSVQTHVECVSRFFFFFSPRRGRNKPVNVSSRSPRAGTRSKSIAFDRNSLLHRVRNSRTWRSTKHEKHASLSLSPPQVYFHRLPHLFLPSVFYTNDIFQRGRVDNESCFAEICKVEGGGGED